MHTYGSALILGYGRSGQAAERLLCAEGVKTTVLAQETSGDSDLFRLLDECAFDICITSPGFSLLHPWICAVRSAGIPLLSELELGWSRHKGKTIAVTGSNGKSTAVKWIFDALVAAGKTAVIGGNYGIPACEAVIERPDAEWLVLEVSSFQLETVHSFRAEVAVVLNVLPNHLDRHKTMEVYRSTKARIFSASREDDVCIVPNELLEAFRSDVGAGHRWVSFGSTSDADFFFEKGQVCQDSETIVDLSGTLFDSTILGSCTGAAVSAACMAAGVPAEAIERAARSFEPLPHRLQRVGELGGVAYVNDSKATNLAAMAAGVLACGKNIHLIAGGLPKESDYTFVKEILAERVRSIYLVGKASHAMYQAWGGVCACVECGSLEVAFSAARNGAMPGDTVLLSPGCASFDQFRSFAERGECFMALFHRIEQAGEDVL
jgi:UDP-N-acetylmuramoylalanine--D-glutamate ligase